MKEQLKLLVRIVETNAQVLELIAAQRKQPGRAPDPDGRRKVVEMKERTA